LKALIAWAERHPGRALGLALIALMAFLHYCGPALGLVGQ